MILTRSFTRTLLAFATLAAVGAAACDKNTTTPTPKDDVKITAALAQSVFVGDSTQMQAAVTGTANDTVLYSTADATIATVNTKGWVKGLKAGSVVITATAKAEQTQKAFATLTVNAKPVVDTTKAKPSVIISSITQGGSGLPVNPENVSGLINVELSVTAESGTLSKVRVLLDGTEVCAQTFGAKSLMVQDVGSQAVNCAINTAKYDATTGAVTFANGPHALSAEAVANGTATATVSTTLQFKNTDGLVVTATAAKTALDAAGLKWNGGLVSLKAIPVMYSGAAISRVNFSVNTIHGAQTIALSDATAADGFTASVPADKLPAANGLKDVQDSITVSAGTVTTAGEAGPMGTAAQMRVDNKAPTISKFVLRNQNDAATRWINGAYIFADTANRATDAGVGGVTVAFKAGVDSVSTKAVATGSDLAESQTTAGYIVAMTATDGLGNAATAWATTDKDAPAAAAANAVLFGVDKTAPVLVLDTAAGYANLNEKYTAAPAENWHLTATDALSGFAASPTSAKVTLLGGVDAAGCLVGTYTTSCAPATAAYVTAVQGTEGYQTYTAYVTDLAGNKSNTVTGTVLYDGTVPVVGTIAVPATITAGQAATFTANVSDNVDLKDYIFDIQYGGVARFLGTKTAVNTAFNGAPVKTATATGALVVLKSIETVDGANAPSGTITAPSVVNVALTDAAGNTGSGSAAVTATGGTTFATGVAATNVSSFAFTDDNATNTVCYNTDASACTNARSVKLTATLTGAASVFANPFARVTFYVRWVGGAAAAIADGAMTTADNGTTRTYTFVGNWTPTAIGTYEIFGLGVDANGKALMTAVQTFVVGSN